MVVFQNSCFSAATEAHNDFTMLREDPYDLPYRPFVAGLPKRFMSLTGGKGVPALIGHVDRVLPYSFFNEATNVSEHLVFERLLDSLLKGHRVGYAMEHLSRWHANYAVQLGILFSKKERGEAVDDDKISRTWLVTNDTRNYVLLGDPAVRLRFD